jgi:hypothetical protein
MADQPSSRHRFQFRLRTLFIGVTLLAVMCGYVGREAKIARERRAMRDEIVAAGGQIGPYCRVAANEPPLPWYRHFLGDRDTGEIVLPDSMVSRVDEIQQIFPESFVTAIPK